MKALYLNKRGLRVRVCKTRHKCIEKQGKNRKPRPNRRMMNGRN